MRWLFWTTIEDVAILIGLPFHIIGHIMREIASAAHDKAHRAKDCQITEQV